MDQRKNIQADQESDSKLQDQPSGEVKEAEPSEASADSVDLKPTNIVTDIRTEPADEQQFEGEE